MGKIFGSSLHLLRHFNRQEFETFFEGFAHFFDEPQSEISEILVLFLENLRSMYVECVEFAREFVAVRGENVWFVFHSTIKNGLFEKRKTAEARSVILGEIEVF